MAYFEWLSNKLSSENCKGHKMYVCESGCCRHRAKFLHLWGLIWFYFTVVDWDKCVFLVKRVVLPCIILKILLYYLQIYRHKTSSNHCITCIRRRINPITLFSWLLYDSNLKFSLIFNKGLLFVICQIIHENLYSGNCFNPFWNTYKMAWNICCFLWIEKKWYMACFYVLIIIFLNTFLKLILLCGLELCCSLK